MTTLIYVGNSEGCVGRCDAKCYDAHYPDCDCICGGKNHSKGLKQALENTSEMIGPNGELRKRMKAMGGDHLSILPELLLEIGADG